MHCQRLKKHFQKLSISEVDATCIEIECSKVGGFCGVFNTTGYPSLFLLEKATAGVQVMKYEGERDHHAMKVGRSQLESQST